MRNTIILILLLMGNLSIAWSQTPQGINYQAVARDAAGACISNQNISIQINLRDSSATGTLLYQEQHIAIPTNEQGLFSLTIGADSSLATGAGQTTKFNELNWISTNHWLEIEMDPTGGATFVIVGAQQLWTVPYAMSAGNGKQLSKVDQNEYFQTLGSNGSVNISLGGTGSAGNFNNGSLSARNENGEVRSSLYSSGNVAGGVGALILYGSNGSFNHIMGTLSGTDLDRGATSIRNENGDSRISHYINSSDQGVKNFIAAHPEDPTKQIWYASLEGPEAAAYERGSAQLVNGEATVDFSDHYRLIVNSNTLTVQLTPLSADSKGMAVIEITENGFKVKELQKGAGNYGFHWRVEGVRKGCEDFEVVREKTRTELIDGVKQNVTNK